MTACERRGCTNVPAEDLRYCSDACYETDNDDLMISPVGRNGSGFVEHGGQSLTRDRRVPLSVRRVNGTVPPGEYGRPPLRTHVFRVDGFDGCAEPGCGLPGTATVHHLPTPTRRVPKGATR